MKAIIVFACFICVFVFVGQVAALPVAEADVADESVVNVPDIDEVAVEDIQEHSRQKRATCDLLSFAGVNHSACAAGCVLKGFRGGYCNGKAVCVCRR